MPGSRRFPIIFVMADLHPAAGVAAGTVLVVEDDAVLRGLVVTLLDGAGYRTVTIADHGLITSAVEQWKPSCVLLDGELDAVGLRRSWADALLIRAAHPSLPVLLFTGDEATVAEARSGTSERSRAAAFAGIVRKPFVIDDFLATLANVVGTAHPASARETPDRPAGLPAVTDQRRSLGADWAAADLFATAVHELRSPLTTISGQIQRASRLMGHDRTRATEALDRALAQVGRMNRLMTDVLDHARLETNALTITLTTLDLGAAIAEAIEQHELGDLSRIAYDRPATPLEVRCDPDRVAQVLGNVIGNAVKYSQPDAPIEVSLRATGAEAQVRVADHGVGVPELERSRLFAPYYRGSRASGISGTGLGLHISRRLAERQGGRLWLETTGDSGSVFALALPLAAS